MSIFLDNKSVYPYALKIKVIHVMSPLLFRGFPRGLVICGFDLPQFHTLQVLSFCLLSFLSTKSLAPKEGIA